MSETLDLEGDAETIAPSQTALASISDLVQKQLRLEAEVAAAETLLKEKQAALRTVNEFDLPTALDAAMTKKFTTSDGITVEVKEDLAMSVPKANRASCAEWLRQNKLGDLLATTVTIQLTKSQGNLVAPLTEFLDKEGFTYTRVEEANTTSVKAAFKRRKEAGEDVPLKLFGGYEVRKAKVTLPKD